jgi:hypothetical protein
MEQITAEPFQIGRNPRGTRRRTRLIFSSVILVVVATLGWWFLQGGAPVPGVSAPVQDPQVTVAPQADETARASTSRPSPVAKALTQKPIVLTAALAGLVLLAALGLTLLPLLQRAWRHLTRRRPELAQAAPPAAEQSRITLAEMVANGTLDEESLARMLPALSSGDERPDDWVPSQDDAQSDLLGDEDALLGDEEDGGRTPEELMRVFIHMDELIAKEDIDLAEVEASQNTIADIFDDQPAETDGGVLEIFDATVEMDPHLEALLQVVGDELEEIDVNDLLHEMERLVDQIGDFG